MMNPSIAVKRTVHADKLVKYRKRFDQWLSLAELENRLVMATIVAARTNWLGLILPCDLSFHSSSKD